MNRILVIDDEEDIREVIKEILALDGWIVDVAEDGKKGIASLIENHHNLVICDISMPGLSGLETLGLIREQGLLAAVVMLTAHAEQERIIQALQLGAIDYVVKPFDPVSLRSKVPTWLEIGRRIQKLANQDDEVSTEVLQKQVRMIELFKLKNHKGSKTS